MEEVKKRVIAKFHPQAWVRGNAVDIDPEGETEFDVTELIEKMGKEAALALRDNTSETDELSLEDCAPQWIRDFRGPCYVEVEESIRKYFGEDVGDASPAS